MNKFLLGCLIVVVVLVFGMVFARQMRMNQDRLANSFVENDSSSLNNIPKAKGDSTAQLDKELSEVNFEVFDEDSAELETEVNDWE